MVTLSRFAVSVTFIWLGYAVYWISYLNFKVKIVQVPPARCLQLVQVYCYLRRLSKSNLIALSTYYIINSTVPNGLCRRTKSYPLMVSTVTRSATSLCHFTQIIRSALQVKTSWYHDLMPDIHKCVYIIGFCDLQDEQYFCGPPRERAQSKLHLDQTFRNWISHDGEWGGSHWANLYTCKLLRYSRFI